MLIAFAWVNATTRKDGSALAASEIAQSVVSQLNDDGTLTAVATLIGNGTAVTADAPVDPGTYKYVVQNIDTLGNVGAPVDGIHEVVIKPEAKEPPAAPSDFTAAIE